MDDVLWAVVCTGGWYAPIAPTLTCLQNSPREKPASIVAGDGPIDPMMSVPATNLTVLVCDDEAPIRQMVAQRLRAAGYTVHEARNGQEAMSLLGIAGHKPMNGVAIRPTLVLTDMQMPMATGLDLCQAMRADPATETVPALMLTARGYIVDEAALAKTNIKEVMGKPFGVRQLVDRIVSMIGPAAAQNAPARNAA